MKKIIIIILSIFFSGNLFSQSDPVYSRRDSAALYEPKSTAIYSANDNVTLLKLNFFNTARFLRLQGDLLMDANSGEIDIPGLTHTFGLTKNTLIQINNAVTVQTRGCASCVMETMVIIYIVIDGSYFASYHLQGDGKKFTSTGTALAQLGPGSHTINIKIIKLRPSGDVTVLGYKDHNVLGNNPNDKGNMTHMSLLFFEQ